MDINDLSTPSMSTYVFKPVLLNFNILYIYSNLFHANKHVFINIVENNEKYAAIILNLYKKGQCLLFLFQKPVSTKCTLS